jgi:hypothetical protein
MDGRTTITLAEWLKWPGPSTYAPILAHPPSVGIHDVRAIDADRTWLWALSDYRVTSVSGGVIWLMPKREEPQC